MNKIKINHPELHHSCSESEDYLGCCEEYTLAYALIDATEQEKRLEDWTSAIQV